MTYFYCLSSNPCRLRFIFRRGEDMVFKAELSVLVLAEGVSESGPVLYREHTRGNAQRRAKLSTGDLAD